MLILMPLTGWRLAVARFGTVVAALAAACLSLAVLILGAGVVLSVVGVI